MKINDSQGLFANELGRPNPQLSAGQERTMTKEHIMDLSGGQGRSESLFVG